MNAKLLCLIIALSFYTFAANAVLTDPPSLPEETTNKDDDNSDEDSDTVDGFLVEAVKPKAEPTNEEADEDKPKRRKIQILPRLKDRSFDATRHAMNFVISELNKTSSVAAEQTPTTTISIPDAVVQQAKATYSDSAATTQTRKRGRPKKNDTKDSQNDNTARNDDDDNDAQEIVSRNESLDELNLKIHDTQKLIQKGKNTVKNSRTKKHFDQLLNQKITALLAQQGPDYAECIRTASSITQLEVRENMQLKICEAGLRQPHRTTNSCGVFVDLLNRMLHEVTSPNIMLDVKFLLALLDAEGCVEVNKYPISATSLFTEIINTGTAKTHQKIVAAYYLAITAVNTKKSKAYPKILEYLQHAPQCHCLNDDQKKEAKFLFASLVYRHRALGSQKVESSNILLMAKYLDERNEASNTTALDKGLVRLMATAISLPVFFPSLLEIVEDEIELPEIRFAAAINIVRRYPTALSENYPSDFSPLQAVELIEKVKLKQIPLDREKLDWLTPHLLMEGISDDEIAFYSLFTAIKYHFNHNTTPESRPLQAMLLDGAKLQKKITLPKPILAEFTFLSGRIYDAVQKNLSALEFYKHAHRLTLEILPQSENNQQLIDRLSYIRLRITEILFEREVIDEALASAKEGLNELSKYEETDDVKHARAALDLMLHVIYWHIPGLRPANFDLAGALKLDSINEGLNSRRRLSALARLTELCITRRSKLMTIQEQKAACETIMTSNDTAPATKCVIENSYGLLLIKENTPESRSSAYAILSAAAVKKINRNLPYQPAEASTMLLEHFSAEVANDPAILKSIYENLKNENSAGKLWALANLLMAKNYYSANNNDDDVQDKIKLHYCECMKHASGDLTIINEASGGLLSMGVKSLK